MYRAKDFIETSEGLVFAVVTDMIEADKVLCFLRYVHEQGQWRKVSTEQANSFLSQNYPEYLHYSTNLDVELHAVAVNVIAKHHQPQHRLTTLLNNKPKDSVEQDLQTLCRLFSQNGLQMENVGVTGSLLIGVQNPDSDIDLVFYGRDVFQQARALIPTLIRQGSYQPLTDNDWLETYQRRDCHLTLQEYVWHEQRKNNKVMINQRKVDLNMEDIGVHVFQLHLGSFKNSPPNASHLVHQDDAVYLTCHFEGIGHGQHWWRIYNDDIVVFPYLTQKLLEPW